jgi:hypothetical protein
VVKCKDHVCILHASDTYFQAYRNEGFDAGLKSAKDITSELGVEQSFCVKRHVSRTNHLMKLNGGSNLPSR